MPFLLITIAVFGSLSLICIYFMNRLMSKSTWFTRNENIAFFAILTTMLVCGTYTIHSCAMPDYEGAAQYVFMQSQLILLLLLMGMTKRKEIYSQRFTREVVNEILKEVNNIKSYELQFYTTTDLMEELKKRTETKNCIVINIKDTEVHIIDDYPSREHTKDIIKSIADQYYIDG